MRRSIPAAEASAGAIGIHPDHEDADQPAGQHTGEGPLSDLVVRIGANLVKLFGSCSAGQRTQLFSRSHVV